VIEKKKLYIIITLLCLAFFVRFYDAGGISGGDDSSYAMWIHYAIEDPTKFVYLNIPDEPNRHSGLFLLRNFSIIPVAPFVLILGETALALRMASLLFGTFSVLLLFMLARRFFNDKVALTAAFLLAVSPMHTLFTRIAFVDGALTFYVLLISLMFIKGIDEKKPYLFYCASIIVLIDMLTTNFRGIVPLVALGAYAIAKKPSRTIWTHLIGSGVLVIVLYVGYSLLPILWGNYEYYGKLFYRIDHAVGYGGKTFVASFLNIGKYMFFTPFLGLILVPAAAGFISTVRKYKKPINLFLLAFLGSSIVFYIQGQMIPSRQTIYVPLFCLFAAIGLYSRLSTQKIMILSLAYYLIMLVVGARYIPEFAFLNMYINNITAFVIIGAACMLVLIQFRPIKILKNATMRKGFLLFNLLVILFLVLSGTGIYRRSDKIETVAEFMKLNLDDEKYGCAAGIHDRTLIYLLNRECAFYGAIDVQWLEEHRDEMKYFLINIEYGSYTAGLGTMEDNVLTSDDPDRQLMIDWIYDNTVDITHSTQIDINHFRLRVIKD